MLSEAQVGTSGFAYREWVGTVYPRGAVTSQLLPLYAERLPAVQRQAFDIDVRAEQRAQVASCVAEPCALTDPRAL